MDLSAIALQSLDQAQVQVDAAATALASAGTNSPDGAGLDTVDLATQIVGLNSAQTLLAADLSTLKTADEIQKNVLSLLA
jgi:hypothetical protein